MIPYKFKVSILLLLTRLSLRQQILAGLPASILVLSIVKLLTLARLSLLPQILAGLQATDGPDFSDASVVRKHPLKNTTAAYLAAFLVIPTPRTFSRF
ncbi:MAG: hypothetical protein AAB561_02305 [Patescibacteria group bacterium]